VGEGGATDPGVEEKRRKIIEMAKHAWDGYTQYAWGQNELKPITKSGHSAVVFGKTPLGATIVDSLDTLYLMGLQDRFEQGVQWVRLSLNIDQVGVAFSGRGYNRNT
jgi:mannosyl-oligosaccharide alpha-1,2-mannosidase